MDELKENQKLIKERELIKQREEQEMAREHPHTNPNTTFNANNNNNGYKPEPPQTSRHNSPTYSPRRNTTINHIITQKPQFHSMNNNNHNSYEQVSVHNSPVTQHSSRRQSQSQSQTQSQQSSPTQQPLRRNSMIGIKSNDRKKSIIQQSLFNQNEYENNNYNNSNSNNSNNNEIQKYNEKYEKLQNETEKVKQEALLARQGQSVCLSVSQLVILH